MSDNPLEDFPVDLFIGLKYLKEQQKTNLVMTDEDPRSKSTRAVYGLALSIEVAEFVNETNWKSWKDKEPDKARVMDEFADVLAFLGTWLVLLEEMGIPTTDLAVAYDDKTKVNRERLSGKVAFYGTPTGGYAGENGFRNQWGDEQLPLDMRDEAAVSAIRGIQEAQAEEPWNPAPGQVLRDPLSGFEEGDDEDDED